MPEQVKRPASNPVATMLALGFASLAPLFWNSWTSVASSGSFLLLVMITLKVDAARIARRSSAILWFVMFIVAVNGFTAAGTVLFSAGGFYLTAEGVETGLRLSSQILLLLWGSTILVSSVPPAGLIDALTFWIPSKSGSIRMLMTLTVGLVPGLLMQARRVRLSLLSRGIDPRGIRRIRFLSMASLPLFAGSVRTADHLSRAMDSRGYEPGIERTSLTATSFGWRDLLFIAASLFFSLAAPVIIHSSGF